MNKRKAIVVGGGLAGCEAANYLANHGIAVILYENKCQEKNPVQKLDLLAELVCSNSLRSNNINNAAGLLKKELQMVDSLIIEAALANAVPAGDALAVDRIGFSQYITNKIIHNSLITIKHEEYKEINLQVPTIIASGPLTSNHLQQELIKYFGNDGFYFYDAVAPIVTKESIDFNIAYYKSRYDKGNNQDYINCPFTKEQYNDWHKLLVQSEIIVLHDFEKEIFFEGCMPIEALAKRGQQTLLFGPLKPVGLAQDRNNPPYAVAQLRQDDASNSLYNLVGFQTNLKWKEQKK